MQCRYFGHIVIQQDPNSHQTSSSSSDGRILYPSVKYLNFPRLLKVGLPSKSHDNPWYCLAACNNVTNEEHKQWSEKKSKSWWYIELTWGSPVDGSVWIKILPMRTSLHTLRKPVSMVPPALRMDTPHIYVHNIPFLVLIRLDFGQPYIFIKLHSLIFSTDRSYHSCLLER